MEKIFSNPTELEQTAKKQFGIPDFMMMENASNALCSFVFNKIKSQNQINPIILILCGKGNNGGDGLALARLLECNKIKNGLSELSVHLFCPQIPSAQEAKTQYEICKALNLSFVSPKDLKNLIDQSSSLTFVDCFYGTGFHGELKPEIKELFDIINNASGLKIACDVPSGLYFKADFTLSMGQQKLAYFSDKAKAACGQIEVADLGISRQQFESAGSTNLWLLGDADAHLPIRKTPAAHKGTYGHTSVLCGSKSGAAILAATAAMNFGSGLTTLVETASSNLGRFKISPELMLSTKIPEKTNACVIGSGFDPTSLSEIPQVATWISNQQKSGKPSGIVFDAGTIIAPDFPKTLKSLCELPWLKIVLTPHLSELSRFFANAKSLCQKGELNCSVDFSDADFSVTNLAESAEGRVKLANAFFNLFPNCTLVMKSAVTFVCSEGSVFVCNSGSEALAKGGSGDVLAGMTGALLAQGYSGREAAISAVQAHAMASRRFKNNYSLTPLKLIKEVARL